MRNTCSGAILFVMLIGCGSDPAPGASTTKDITLPDSPLVRLKNVSLIRAGDQFTLAGYDSGLVRWARLSLDGVVSNETSFALPTVVGPNPVFATTKSVSAGDQLIALAFTNGGTAGTYDLVAVVETVGDSAAASPVVLATLPVGTDLSLVQLAAGGAASGNIGFVAWGIRVSGISVSYLLLPAGAITTAQPSQMDSDNVQSWDCLSVVNSGTGLSFGVTVPDTLTDQTPVSDYRTVTLSETGGSTTMTYQLDVQIANCNVVSVPNSSGSYYMAFQGTINSSTAIDFATYFPSLDPSKGSGTVTTQKPVLPAALFGDPLSLPSVAWVTSAGSDVVMGLSRASGPEVYRFEYNAVPHGGTLHLRSQNGKAGPVAAWVDSDLVYVTYTDQPSSGTLQRYFMRVQSPATLP